jgi:hypothetical protein
VTGALTSLPSHACHHTPRAHDTHAIALSLDEKPLWLVRYRLYLAEGSPPRVCVCCALHSVPPPAHFVLPLTRSAVSIRRPLYGVTGNHRDG